MYQFIHPDELSSLLTLKDGSFLLVSFDDDHTIFKRRQTLQTLLNLFGERLRIMLVEVKHQNTIMETFKIHGVPTYLFRQEGNMKDLLFVMPEPEMLREFVIEKFKDRSIN